MVCTMMVSPAEATDFIIKQELFEKAATLRQSTSISTVSFLVGESIPAWPCRTWFMAPTNQRAEFLDIKGISPQYEGKLTLHDLQSLWPGAQHLQEDEAGPRKCENIDAWYDLTPIMTISICMGEISTHACTVLATGRNGIPDQPDPLPLLPPSLSLLRNIQSPCCLIDSYSFPHAFFDFSINL